jgi:hypothetical protein
VLYTGPFTVSRHSSPFAIRLETIVEVYSSTISTFSLATS